MLKFALELFQNRQTNKIFKCASLEVITNCQSNMGNNFVQSCKEYTDFCKQFLNLILLLFFLSEIESSTALAILYYNVKTEGEKST